MSLAADIDAALRAVFAGRRVVLAGEVAAGAAGRVAELRALGAQRCLVLSLSRGTGPLPDPEFADVVVCEQPPVRDVVASFRQEETLLAAPPRAFLDAIDRFDVDGDALVLAAPFAAVYAFAGRSVYGARRPEWVALEDKARADELLASAGVAVPDHEVVAAEADALAAAAAGLDRGNGTVWAGDARGGFNGGAIFVRWVRDRRDREEATAFFGARCDRVRVATFTEGIPCSIHGFVTSDGVAVFRPVELVTLRRTGVPQFLYAGAATFWDPPDADRVAMRAGAARVGAELRDRAGFRGAFTVDGILGAGGWVATECNPRFGAGLTYARTACPELRLGLLNSAVVAGDAEGIRARELETAVVAAADAQRWGGTWSWTNVVFDGAARLRLCGDAQGYRTAAGDEAADAHLEYGTGPTGGFVRVEFGVGRTPAGPSIAPRAVAALAFADRRLASNFGTLTPACTVR